MINLKKKILNLFNEFRETLNGVSGKLKLRTIYVFVSVFTLIIFVRIITNLNPQYISDLSSKYSDRMSSKEAFLIASEEIFSMLEIRILNVVRTINVISEILKSQESKVSFDSNFYCQINNYTGRVCNIDCNNSDLKINSKKCYNPEQEKFYPQAQEDIFYSSSAYIDFDQGVLPEDMRKKSKIVDLYLTELYLNYNKKLDIFSSFNIMYSKMKFVREYPAKYHDPIYFEKLYNNQFEENWYMKALSINNEQELYITILSEENSVFVSKPFFDENKNVLGVVAASIDGISLSDQLDNGNMICNNWQNYIFNSKSTIINSISNSSNIFDEIDSLYCSKLYEYFFARNETEILKNITCESETPPSYIITVKPLLNLTFHNEFLFLAQTCKENNIIGSRSERIIIIYRYSYIFTYLCFFTLFMIITAIYIKRFVRNIINPIKQVTYKIHRVLKMMFKKKNSILIDDNIVIREKTEIRDIAECFSICFRKLMKKNIFMNELKLGENLISGKQKSIHNKIPEKMMDIVKESIEKIPNSFQEKCD